MMDPQQRFQYTHERQNSAGINYPPHLNPASGQQMSQQPPPLQPHPMYPNIPSMSHPPPPLQHHHDPSLAHHQPMHQAHVHLLQSFWMRQMHEVQNLPQDFKNHHLPLARIKKVMKTDDEVKVGHYNEG